MALESNLLNEKLNLNHLDETSVIHDEADLVGLGCIPGSLNLRSCCFCCSNILTSAFI